jgi:hypothetical protein
VLPIAVLKQWFKDASFEYQKTYFPDNKLFDIRGVTDFLRRISMAPNQMFGQNVFSNIDFYCLKNTRQDQFS